MATEAGPSHWLAIPGRGALHMDNTSQAMTHNSFKLFTTWPFFSPLVLPNESSDARDHCANERTFLSWIRLAVYLNIVSVAIFVNFHFKEQPSSLELRTSRPLGIIFWILSVVCIINGYVNYVRTVARYARRRALVQYGSKTQIVFVIVCTAIIVACVIFISSSAQAEQQR